MGKKCSICNKKIGFREQKMPFKDSDNNKIFICSDCYVELTKDKKKNLSYLGKWQVPKSARITGFMAGGVVGAVASGDGYRSGREWVIKRKLKKNNKTKQDLDNLSIDKYNLHFWLLPEEVQNRLLEKLGI